MLGTVKIILRTIEKASSGTLQKKFGALFIVYQMTFALVSKIDSTAPKKKKKNTRTN